MLTTEQTRENHATGTLDVEPNRLILHIPDTYELDVPLVFPPTSKTAKLYEQVHLDVNNTRAEWRVGEGKLIVRAQIGA